MILIPKFKLVHSSTYKFFPRYKREAGGGKIHGASKKSLKIKIAGYQVNARRMKEVSRIKKDMKSLYQNSELRFVYINNQPVSSEIK